METAQSPLWKSSFTAKELLYGALQPFATMCLLASRTVHAECGFCRRLLVPEFHVGRATDMILPFSMQKGTALFIVRGWVKVDGLPPI